MNFRSLLLGVTLLASSFSAACGGSGQTVQYDIGAIDDAVPSDCAALSQCIAFCAGDGGTSTTCVSACRTTATQAAQTAYDAINTCVTNTCSAATDDAGSAICADTSSVECMRCQTNSRYKDTADCTGAPPYCGACATEQAACTSS